MARLPGSKSGWPTTRKRDCFWECIGRYIQECEEATSLTAGLRNVALWFVVPFPRQVAFGSCQNEVLVAGLNEHTDFKHQQSLSEVQEIVPRSTVLPSLPAYLLRQMRHREVKPMPVRFRLSESSAR